MRDLAELVDVRQCPICASTSSEPFESFEDEGRLIAYRVCENCGTVYQSPRMSQKALRDYYEAEYVSQHQQATGVTEKELRIQAGRARHLTGILTEELSTVDRHLDIGSSTGSLMLAIQRSFSNVSIGIEPAQVYRAYCRARGFAVVPDLESLSGDKFDLITMAHVVEHLADPVDYLRTLREQWLTAAGMLLVEVPNLYGHRSVEVPHLFCFSAQTLEYALARAGFETVRMDRHGSPRSKVIPLYITSIAKPNSNVELSKPNSKNVRIKRRSGMAWNTLTSRLLPSLAWLPLPELEAELE